MRLFHGNQAMQAHTGMVKARLDLGMVLGKNHQQTPPQEGPATQLSPSVTSV